MRSVAVSKRRADLVGLRCVHINRKGDYIRSRLTTKLQYAVFFAGWPPVALKADRVQCLLADECEDMIDVPTCHIVGCKDNYIGGAMALYSMCDEDTAILFDHGKGHTVPRDSTTIKELSSAIEQTFARREVAV